MFLFLRTPFLSLPEKLIPDRVLTAIMEYHFKSEKCGLFCFLGESFKITAAYFKKGPGVYEYVKILKDKTKSNELRADVLLSIYNQVKAGSEVEKDKELYEAILKIAADKQEHIELRLRAFDILKIVKNNDPKVKEIALEIIRNEPSNPFSSVKASATKLLAKEAPGDIDLLFDLLESDDRRVSANAEDLLLKNYPREAYWRIGEIVNIALDKKLKPVARAGAIGFISNLNRIFGGVKENQEVINALKKLLNDEHGGIRGITADVLEEITGEKYEIGMVTEEEENEILW